MSYFIKKTRTKTKKDRGLYLQIYKGHYDPQKGTTVHTSYKVYGYEDDLRAKGISDPIAMIQQEVDRLNAEEKEKKDSHRKITDSPIRHLGYFPLKAVMNTLDIKKYFNYFQMPYEKRYNIFDLFEALVYARAVCPCSKSKTIENVIPYLYGYGKGWSYDSVLDCCEFLGEYMSRIIELLADATKEKYGVDTSATYFDCTNFYFEIDREDWLRRKGHSKERRSEPLVGLGVLLDRKEIPINMKMYPGSKSEKPVMKQAINEVKKRGFDVKRTIRVADKGLNSAHNIHDAVKENDGYIFSKSVKMLSKDEKKWVFETEEPWTNVYYEDDEGREKLRYRFKECMDYFPYTYEDENGQTVKFSVFEKRIVTYNPKLAKKQKMEILKRVNKAMNLSQAELKRKELGSLAKYVTFEVVGKDGKTTGADIQRKENRKAIEEDLREAGYNIIVTSETYMDTRQIYSTYHRLWRIEETFKLMKSELDARPVYLQNENRIYGHFLICYTAVLLLRILELKVLKDRVPSTRLFDFIREFSVIDLEGRNCINVTKPEYLLHPIQAVFETPLDTSKISKASIQNLLDKKIRAMDADGNILK